MRYMIGTKEVIMAFNQQEAILRNCSGTTTEWYASRETASGSWCLYIDDDKYTEGTTTEEPEWPPEEI